MLMKIRPDLEPLMRLRSALPENCLATFEILVGTVSMPPDQPCCATAVGNLAKSLVTYGNEIRFVYREFQKILDDARLIGEVALADRNAIEGLPPLGQMAGRIAQHAAWSLLIQLARHHIPLLVALGAEVAAAVLEKGQLNDRFCQQLRRDIRKFGQPADDEQHLVEDLCDMGFGRGWLAHFNKADRQVRRQVELPDPSGPARPDHAAPKHRLDILARLRWRFEYPDPKHRQAALDDSHLPVDQYRRASAAVRQSVEQHDPRGVVQALAILTRLTPDLTLSLPLVSADKPLQYMGIDIQLGALILDLRILFPNRKVPALATQLLFHISADTLTVPLPTFLAKELRRRAEEAPGAVLLGDLVGWVRVDHRISLVEGERCKLVASTARAAKSTGAMAIRAGADRLVAACLTWDFSFIGSARMYYARLTGRDIHNGCAALYSTMQWGEPALVASELPAIGSHCTLTHPGVQNVFNQLAQQCHSTWPGRRANVNTLLRHHEHYTRYTVALLSFCLGLREVHVYRLLAQEILNGQRLITLHDKQGGDRLMAQPVALNSLLREQIRQYVGHCHALLKRLHVLASPEGKSLANTLQSAIDGSGPLFLVRSSRGAIRPAGAYNTWRALPADIRVPANVGRHFWQNELRGHGLSSRDIDRFMRHRVVGLESNTNSQRSSPSQSFDRIDRVQVEVLHHLNIGVVSGIRKV